MNSHVPLQLIRTRELLAAPRVRACERPFARMRSDVFGQVGRFYKTLLTIRADKWLFAVMCAHVDR